MTLGSSLFANGFGGPKSGVELDRPYKFRSRGLIGDNGPRTRFCSPLYLPLHVAPLLHIIWAIDTRTAVIGPGE